MNAYTTLAGILLLVLGLSAPAAGATILQHDLQIRLHPEEGRLEGVDTLRVGLSGESELRLVLAPQSAVESVRVAGRAAPFAWMQGRLAIRLPDDGGGDQTEIRIRYSGIFRDPVPEAPVSAEDPSYGVSGSIQPQGTFLSASAGWYPDIPGSHATYRLHIETPAGVKCVTAGRRLEEGIRDGRNYVAWETTVPLPSLALAAGPFVVHDETVDGIPVATYFYPQSDALAAGYLRAAKGYLQLYRELFGPYPFEKFAVVENFFPTGYGFPSWTLIGSSVVRLPFIVETSLGHEIAHSWWGNGVLVDPASGNWSEGLTTYVADHLYKERSSAAEGREYRLKILRDYATLVPPEKDFPLQQFSARRSAAMQAVGYGKAAMVFHMLRRRVGEEAFWGGLRQVAEEKMYRTASWEDFFTILGRSSGLDPAGFRQQWIERSGAPQLHLEGVAAEWGNGRWLVRGSLVQTGPIIYDLTVPLSLETTAGTLHQSLACTGKVTPFSFDLAERPLRLEADPDVDLFRRLAPGEIPPTVNSLRGSGPLLVIVSATLAADVAEASALLPSALQQQDARMVKETEVDVKELAGHDILYLGLPERRGLLPVFPGGLVIGRDTITLNGEVFARDATTLFVAAPHPTAGDRSSALFLPATAAQAATVARKIPHYGKYSYLLFSDGLNRSKGVWPISESPLVHDFQATEE